MAFYVFGAPSAGSGTIETPSPLHRPYGRHFGAMIAGFRDPLGDVRAKGIVLRGVNLFCVCLYAGQNYGFHF